MAEAAAAAFATPFHSRFVCTFSHVLSPPLTALSAQIGAVAQRRTIGRSSSRPRRPLAAVRGERKKPTSGAKQDTYLAIDSVDLSVLVLQLGAHIERHVSQITDHRVHLAHVLLHLIFPGVVRDPARGMRGMKVTAWRITAGRRTHSASYLPM